MLPRRGTDTLCSHPQEAAMGKEKRQKRTKGEEEEEEEEEEIGLETWCLMLSTALPFLARRGSHMGNKQWLAGGDCQCKWQAITTHRSRPFANVFVLVSRWVDRPKRKLGTTDSLRLQIDAATKPPVECLLQLPHLFLDTLEPRLELLHLRIDALGRAFDQFQHLRLRQCDEAIANLVSDVSRVRRAVHTSLGRADAFAEKRATQKTPPPQKKQNKNVRDFLLFIDEFELVGDLGKVFLLLLQPC